ncbi:uncharacterized protein LOC119503048 isoform X2 [Sebastes umbrosus]|uniref:uncharacterized protein LOC119503048 isoform X2 n=1 Tax=Sebastes umbrosus TaxID=72105 RepID=UPI00189F35DF|nr:uncharacterized protein LOC119503048 isoform X2 [Sebastes umbrosus]
MASLKSSGSSMTTKVIFLSTALLIRKRVIAHVMALSDIEEEEEEEEEDEDAWSDPSEDSGYESKSEHEEDSEDDDINVIIRPLSPLNQLFPAPSFWQGLHRGSSPVGRPAGAPFCCNFGVLPAQQEERPEEGQPSVCQRSEESAPSTSGLSSSTKRNREEDCTEQLGVKRQSQCKDSHEEPASSTSGLSSSAKRSREEDCTEQVGVKRQRQYEDSHEEPASSTSGLGSSTNRSREEDYYRYGFRRYWQFSPDNSDSDSD